MNVETLKQMNLKGDPEAYKFTHLNTGLNGLKEVSSETAVSINSSAFYNLVFKDGVLQEKLSIPGVKINVLDNAPTTQSYPFTPLMTQLPHAYEILIDKNTRPTKPIRIVNIHNEVSAIKIHVGLGPNAQVAIFEDGTQNSHKHVSISEMTFTLNSGAKLEHLQIDNAYETGLHHNTLNATVDKDASYKNISLHIGGHMIRKNQSCFLNAPGANGELYSLYLTHKSEHSDLNSIIHHCSADTNSGQISKGILSGESKGIFTGRIHIHPQAQRVTSGQLNKNLLLSKKAQAHSQPQLEIFADDVKCSHGSTTGQLSPEELFYFKARGIPENKARSLLAHGFGMEVVLKIADPNLRKTAEILVGDVLKNKYHLGGGHE